MVPYSLRLKIVIFNRNNTGSIINSKQAQCKPDGMLTAEDVFGWTGHILVAPITRTKALRGMRKKPLAPQAAR